MTGRHFAIGQLRQGIDKMEVAGSRLHAAIIRRQCAIKSSAVGDRQMPMGIP
jgi:hypothetical protein